MNIELLYQMEMIRKRRLRQSIGYRTEDLVLHLDGIQNTRAGTHDPSATVWEDLSGNGMDVALTNGTWAGDYVSFSGNGWGVGSKYRFENFCTIEVVYKQTAPTGRYGSGLAGWYMNNAADITITPGQVANATGYKYRYRPNNDLTISIGGDQINRHNYMGFTSGLLCSNGFSSSHSITSHNLGETSCFFYLGTIALTPSSPYISDRMPIIGNIYAVRVYDANLTAEELYAHWLIDKARFNIPD